MYLPNALQPVLRTCEQVRKPGHLSWVAKSIVVEYPNRIWIREEGIELGWKRFGRARMNLPEDPIPQGEEIRREDLDVSEKEP